MSKNSGKLTREALNLYHRYLDIRANERHIEYVSMTFLIPISKRLIQQLNTLNLNNYFIHFAMFCSNSKNA